MRFLPPKNRKPPIVIIVALIDVLLVVLIFMVVSTTFTNQAAVKLVLPESSQAKAAPAVNDSLIVTVAKEPPHFFFGTSAVAAADLEVELKQRTADNPELELSIRADTDAPWGRIVKLMDAAKAAAVQLLQAIGQENAGSPIHQMGLVSFRNEAKVESPLIADMASLETKVQQMWPDGGTNIGDGLYKALDLLAGATGRKFIILLSDGLPNNGLQSPQEFLDGPVAQAKSMGVCIYTIGLGEGGEMNAELLRSIAEGSGCGQFYLAKEAFQLRAIYVRIQHETTGERVQESLSQAGQEG